MNTNTTNFSDLPSTHENVAREILAAFRAGEVVCLVGKRGSGMVMVAKRAAGFLGPDAPFRAPHHTISQAGMLGRPTPMLKPGELTLAAGGVLLLDEAAEFNSHVLDHVASTVKSGEVHLPTGSDWVKLPGPGNLILIVSEEERDVALERALVRFKRRDVPVRVVEMPPYEDSKAYHKALAEGRCPSTEELMAS